MVIRNRRLSRIRRAATAWAQSRDSRRFTRRGWAVAMLFASGVLLLSASPGSAAGRIGDPCGDGAPLCAVGRCVDGFCCNADPACAAGDRCDIFGYEGRCLPPLEEAQPCNKGTDCEAGLICEAHPPNDDVARCTFVAPTPTRWPTVVAPTPDRTKIVTTRCFSDCDGDRSVNVDEILRVVEVLLGNRPVADCENADRNVDGRVTVDELTAGIVNALEGCPSNCALICYPNGYCEVTCRH